MVQSTRPDGESVLANCLLAEDVLLLLLLLLDDERGTLSARSGIQQVLGGAVLAELALNGGVELGSRSGFWRQARVRVAHRPAVGGGPSAGAGLGEATLFDPVLTRSITVIAEKPRTAQGLVGELGKGLRQELTERLAARGLIERHEGRVRGLFPRTTWPTRDAAHEKELRLELRRVLIDGEEPSDRTLSLIAVLNSVGQIHAVTGGDKRAVKQRAQQLSEGQWAAKAVKAAIDAATNAAVTG